jgi:hypothetical protein
LAFDRTFQQYLRRPLTEIFNQNYLIMKNLSFVFAFFFVLSFSIAQAQTSSLLTLEASVNLKQATDVILNASGDLETTYWNEDFIRIELIVDSNIDNYAVMKEVAGDGRYKVFAVYSDEEVSLHLSGLKKIVTVNGKILDDHLKYRIYLPLDVNFKQELPANDRIAGY